VATDLAPIDLIIQRAGRLWRHDRPERSCSPEVLVVSPDPVDEPDPDWYARLFRRGSYVYRHHGRLWLTARVLRDAAAIRSPKGLRELVEAVYGETVEMPAGLEERSWAEEGREGAAAGFGRQNVLKLSNGYDRAGGLSPEERTPTRLVDEEQVTLRLARVEAGEVVPWAPIVSLHANPVMRRRTTEARPGGNGHRVRKDDVVMNAIKPLPQGERAAARFDAICDSGRAWLRVQGEKAGFLFDPGEVAIEGYAEAEVRRRGSRPIRFHTIDLDGRLTVTDPVALTAALAKGFGSARAFGCGLMLIRRA
jgi:hypothetical protein